MNTTLVTVSGMSPAIITETLWALAGESPAIVPDEVVVITTARGEEDIQKMLLTKLPEWGDKSVWETLRADIFKRAKLPISQSGLQLSVRVIDLPNETTGVREKARDIRTPQENAEAADFILRTLAQYTDAEDRRVIASIAGGRKTMGALLYAAMSLVGKESDRVTHVLVSEPFETCRGFFYRDQPVQALTAGPREKPVSITASDAVIELADIPFVPLRNGFQEMNESRRSFAGLVERYSNDLKRPRKGPPEVTLNRQTGELEVDHRPVKLSGRDLLVAWFLLDRAMEGKPHFRTRDDAAVAAGLWHEAWKRQYPSHQATSRMSGLLSVDDITKGLNSLRSKLAAKGLGNCIAYLAPERSRIGFEIAGI